MTVGRLWLLTVRLANEGSPYGEPIAVMAFTSEDAAYEETREWKIDSCDFYAEYFEMDIYDEADPMFREEFTKHVERFKRIKEEDKLVETCQNT